MKKITLFLLFFSLSVLVIPQEGSISLTSAEGNILTLSAWDDDDGDGIANILEVQGFTYNPIDGLQLWDGDTTKKYYITDPLRWSTDGDPYSDYMEVTGVNMPAGVLAPENHPLVAARPIIRMGMESFDVIPISTITNTEGGDSSSSFTNTTSNENQVGVKVGSEFSFNPFKLASVSVEASYSHTWVNTESSTSSFGHNWSKTKSTNPSEAARLRLRVFMENIGSASALDVRPTFNLMIGNKTIATVTPNQVANILSPKNTSNSRYPQNGTIAIEKDQDNNDIILSLEELKSLQMGSPLSLVVIQVDANVIRWNSQTQDWTSNISWTSFENEINPVSIEILSEFGTDESKIYQVFAGTEYWNPEYNLRQILSNIFSVEDVNGETFIEGRKYPGDWYFSTSSVSILNEYNNQGQPENLLGLKMSKNSKLVMMTPGGNPNPLVSLATYSSDFKRIYVSAFPNNFPIISVKAKVKIGGSEKEIQLTQGNGAFFTNAALFESSAEPQGTVIVENARGDVTQSTIIFPALYTSALDVKENASLLPNPGGDYLLFINGDEEKPVYIYCMFFKPGTDSLLETPREYLRLAKSFATTGEPRKYNYSFIPKTDSTKSPNYTYMYYGNDLTNYYEKVRINLSTLAVDPNDTTFTSSTGYLTLSEFTSWGGGYPVSPTFRTVPFGSSGNCYYNYEDRIENAGYSNINFENTSFKIDTTNLNEIIGTIPTDPSGDFIDFIHDTTFVDYSFTEWTIDMSGGGYPGFFGLTDSLRLVYAGFASPTSIEEIEINESIPSDFVLEQNYPNPFNPVTTIEFKIPEQTQVNLKIYDITGSEVAELVNEVKNAGNYRVTFTADNLASGIYIYRIQTNTFSAAKKLMLMK
jgi:hypothetical protein